MGAESTSSRAGERALLHLFGDLLVEGPTPALLQTVGTMPVLDDLFAAVDEEELAAQHYALFFEKAYPYGGLYLNDDAVCGGTLAEQAEDRWRASGRPRPHPGTSADHLGILLRLACEVDDDDARAELIQRLVLPWLPPFAAAAESTRSPWGELVSLTVELCGALATAEKAPTRVSLPEATDLADPSLRLRDIARWMATPSQLGALLTRSQIAELGREQDLGRGFGGRLQTLENSMGSAADYGDLGAWLRNAGRLLKRYGDGYRSLPLSEVWTRPWAERAEQSSAALSTMSARASQVIAERGTGADAAS